MTEHMFAARADESRWTKSAARSAKFRAKSTGARGGLWKRSCGQASPQPVENRSSRGRRSGSCGRSREEPGAVRRRRGATLGGFVGRAGERPRPPAPALPRRRPGSSALPARRRLGAGSSATRLVGRVGSRGSASSVASARPRLGPRRAASAHASAAPRLGSRRGLRGASAAVAAASITSGSSGGSSPPSGHDEDPQLGGDVGEHLDGDRVAADALDRLRARACGGRCGSSAPPRAGRRRSSPSPSRRASRSGRR